MNAIDRTMARLKALEWAGNERKATVAAERAIDGGDFAGFLAHAAWASVCTERVKAWKEEAER